MSQKGLALYLRALLLLEVMLLQHRQMTFRSLILVDLLDLNRINVYQVTVVSLPRLFELGRDWREGELLRPAAPVSGLIGLVEAHLDYSCPRAFAL